MWTPLLLVSNIVILRTMVGLVVATDATYAVTSYCYESEPLRWRSRKVTVRSQASSAASAL